MQDEQVPVQKKDAQTLTTRAQQLIKNLRSVWPRLREPSSEIFPRILQSLPNEYQTMGREVIAERLANNIKLHFLDIVATFHEKAEAEGLDIEELGETLENAKWSAIRLMQIDKSLSVNSVEDLLKFTNITVGLLTLSQVDTAEQAQRWIYKLPTLYQNRLEQQHLATGSIEVTFKISLNNLWHMRSDWHTTSQKVVISPSGEIEKPLLEAPKTPVTWWGQQPDPPVHIYSKTGDTSLPSVM